MREIPFTELLSHIADNRGRTCPTAPSGRPLIATNCISNNDLYPSYETERYVSDETYRTWFRAHPLPGDIIFVCKGSPGRVALAPDPVDFCIAQDMVAVRADESRVYPKYLFAALRSQVVQDRINNMHVGTLIPHFKKGDFDKLQIPLPDRNVQEFIGDTYFELSEKIEQNRRTGRALEGLARATFKAWFVDFEPVKAKAAGQTSFPGLPPAAFAALPDRLTDSPLGPVPQGWGVGTMGDVGEQRREQVAPGEVHGETPYIGLEHMPRRDITLSSWGVAASVTSSKFRFRRGDILFGKLRPYFHKVGPAPLGGVCSTDVVVLFPKKVEYGAWLLMLVSSDEFVAHTDRSSAGTKMPRTNWKDMATFPVALPPASMTTAYQNQVGPMLDMIEVGIHESSKLAALRDYLLPRLLSGRVRVREAEKRVEDIA